MVAIQEQQLFQSTPPSTSPVSAYSPGASETAVIKSIIVANTDTVDHAFSIYVDDDGTTYDDTTAIFKDIPIKANETLSYTGLIAMNNSSGNLAVETDSANNITFTGFGAVINE